MTNRRLVIILIGLSFMGFAAVLLNRDATSTARVVGFASTVSADPAESNADLRLTILYDNNAYKEGLQTKWGFSCLVRGIEKTIIFDVGGDSSILLSNMKKLGIDPGIVDAIVLSHVHVDHIGGLNGFLKANNDVTVYMPQSLPDSVKRAAKGAGAVVVEVHEPLRICPNVYSTGELGSWIKEQSLVIKTTKGLVVITGCAHPGIVSIVKRAKEMLKHDVYLALGGFHLCWMKSWSIKGIVKGMKGQEVTKVAPCHCSGDNARNLFKKAWGDDFVLAGVGRTVTVKNAFGAPPTAR